MTITYTNGGITITKDLIFDWSILTDIGWLPLIHFSKNDLEKIQKVITQDIFPSELKTFIKYKIISLKESLEVQEDLI